MICFLVFSSAFYKWGAIGTLIVVFAVLGAISYVFDRRAQKRVDTGT